MAPPTWSMTTEAPLPSVISRTARGRSSEPLLDASARPRMGARRDGARRARPVDLPSIRRWPTTEAEQVGNSGDLVAAIVGHERSGLSLGRYSEGAEWEAARRWFGSVKLPTLDEALTPKARTATPSWSRRGLILWINRTIDRSASLCGLGGHGLDSLPCADVADEVQRRPSPRATRLAPVRLLGKGAARRRQKTIVGTVDAPSFPL